MPRFTFSTFPECCQKLLRELDREGKGGTRNCEKGHAVSLSYARLIEAQPAGGSTPPGSNKSAA